MFDEEEILEMKRQKTDCSIENAMDIVNSPLANQNPDIMVTEITTPIDIAREQVEPGEPTRKRKLFDD
ncbi:hypothetical protein FRX31_018411 [Thalictrum thalictroides]|uniref:Uncharacterized protein n=1 Tax=Thalictrum thalictroides TaxID=46969 RepID=A0A7J6W629_THATH|nr:hypothetical protein FRX31_018411 [Thalictrum thalictroides]